MKIFELKPAAFIFFATLLCACKAQHKAISSTTAGGQGIYHQRPDPYPRISLQAFTKVWKGQQNCLHNSMGEMALTITAKDSFTVNIAGLNATGTGVEGKVRGYSVNIKRQHIKPDGTEVEGRLVLSNNRESLKSYFYFFSNGKQDTCTGIFNQ